MNIILIGHGKMGRMIEDMISAREDVRIVGIVDEEMYSSPADVPEACDVMIDFSYPGNLSAVLTNAIFRNCAVVLGTTGYTPDQLRAISDASQRIPVMHSSNYSLGVAVMKMAVARMAPLLKDLFDMEIVETHHNQKADAPSGTAKMLLKAVDPDDEYRHVYGREGVTGKRGHEIGIHALRGGTKAGEHSVYFFGEDEEIEVRHSASSRKIFAVGAVKAAEFIAARSAGLYTMDDVLQLND